MHSDPSKTHSCFHVRPCIPGKLKEGWSEGVFLTRSCSLWSSAVRIWELVFTGGRGERELSSSWDGDGVCPVNWAGRGDLREEGKENLSAPSPKPALPGICCQNQHYSHFPHLTWILSMQAPKLHISSIPQLRLSQDFEEKFFSSVIVFSFIITWSLLRSTSPNALEFFTDSAIYGSASPSVLAVADENWIPLFLITYSGFIVQ